MDRTIFGLNQIFKALFLLASLFLCAPQALAETVYIPSADYTDTLCREIQNARSSVDVTMYLFSVDPQDPDSKPFRVFKALVEAHDRGVKVRVLLDETYEASAAERRYGPDLMAQAAQKVTTKRADNPKRSLRYFLRTLDAIARSDAPQTSASA